MKAAEALACLRGEVCAHVRELWRYPVKSMRGEAVQAVEVQADGIACDRRYAFLSTGAPQGKPRLTSRERAAMLRYAARMEGAMVEVLTPGAERYAIDDPALLVDLESRLAQGHRLTLEHEPAAAPYTDVRPVALVSAQTLAALDRTYGRPVDRRRFRANLVLHLTTDAATALTGGDPTAFPEDAFFGQTLQIGGTCRLRILERIPRCRMVTLDPETTESDPALMRHLDRSFGGRVGVYAAVETPGKVGVGDPVVLLPPPLPADSRPTE